jgi:hypothetical protein
MGGPTRRSRSTTRRVAWSTRVRAPSTSDVATTRHGGAAPEQCGPAAARHGPHRVDIAQLFQPLLQAFGPFLVAFADGDAAADPSLVPLIARVERSGNSGFTVISPIYGSYRSQFLTAESAPAPLVKTAEASATT